MNLTQAFKEFYSTIDLKGFWDAIQPSMGIILTFLPIAVAISLFIIFWEVWVKYVRAEFIYKEKVVLLGIRLPKETFKSPAAMELFLTTLHQTGGEGSWYDKFWLGKMRPWFSLEMVSLEGQVHFFIWTRASFKNFIETSLYAQFPGIEVNEVDDYTKSVHFEGDKMVIWGAELTSTKPDFYPIKTYIDYGLDKDPKEEFKVDPLAPLLEFLGAIGVNQQAWIQIIVRAHKAEHKKAGHFWKTTDKWKDEAAAEINKILNRDPKTKVAMAVDDSGSGQRIIVTPGEQDLVKAIERSLSKQAYDVGIRLMYIAAKESFASTNIPGMLGSFKQFNTEHMNGFKPRGDQWSPKFSYPWQDFKNIRQNKMRAELLNVYKRRAFFFDPYHGNPMVLNSEELATIFHFPGQVAATPTLGRVGSKKGQAPANLPV